MATNPPSGDGHRNGAVKDRSQTFNPVTKQWIKRDSVLWSSVFVTLVAKKYRFMQFELDMVFDTR